MTKVGKPRSERGAVAIVFALCSILLFSVAALTVDLGNAMVRKRDVQSQADFAALAGGAGLGASNAKLASDPAVIAAAAYLNENLPQDDNAGPTPLVTAAQLVDGGLTSVYPAGSANGEVYFLAGNQMRVVSPSARVNFGLARIMGFDALDVQAEATVGIRSFGNVMPFFAVSGCDYGPQTLTDPTPGHATGLNLYLPGDSNAANLTSINPPQVALNATTSLDIVGSGFTHAQAAKWVTKVGFFKTDASVPVEVTVTPTSATNIHIASVPTAVTSVEQVWYVRVYRENKWSQVDQAKPFRVGNAVLECAGASNDGNFGTLKLPRLDSNNSASNGWLPINIATGLQAPMSMAVYPGSPPPNLCTTASQPPAVISTATTGGLKEGTNCVDTDTGFAANSATAGLITGATNGALTVTGRLDKDTTPGCGANPADRNARWDTDVDKSGPGDYEINDDILTCFFTNTTTTIANISNSTYAGPAVLDKSIYESPRFFLVPVLAVDPSSGGSQKYTLIGMRPGFITDQPLASSKATHLMGTATHNGLSIDHNAVNTVKVVFFDIDALPQPDDGVSTVAYMGVGPKLIRLVN